MSRDKDLIGEAGESSVKTALLRTISTKKYPGYPKFLFKVIALGEKAELFDYLVYLRDSSGNLTGAHFYVQVKSTEKRVAGGQCPAPFSAGEVKTALTFKVPSYLCAVKIGAVSRIYVRGVSHTRRKGFSGVGITFQLNDAAVRLKLYDEVTAFFANQSFSFSSAF